MWFAVNLLFESVHAGGPRDDALWEERLLLIQAETGAAAQRRAEEIGKAEEHEYVSATGEHVRWTFRRVERVYEIQEESLTSGTELFSRFLRSREVDSLLTPFGR